MQNRANPPYEFAGNSYADITSLVAALMESTDPKSDVSHLQSKAIKNAILDELSKTPFAYRDPMSGLYHPDTACSRLLQRQQKSGLASRKTESYLEYNLLNERLQTSTSNHSDFTHLITLFNQEEAFTLNRSILKFKTDSLDDIKASLYAERALRYMQADCYARAFIDFSIARQHIQFLLNEKILKTEDSVINSVRNELRSHHLICAYQMGALESVLDCANILSENKALTNPEAKVYAAVVALKNPASGRAPRYNPLRLLCEVLAEVQSTRGQPSPAIINPILLLIKDEALFRTLHQYDTHGLLIDFICLLPYLPQGNGNLLQSVSSNYPDQQLQKLFSLSNFNTLADKNRRLTAMGTLGEGNADRYPDSAFIHYLLAYHRRENKEVALHYLRKSLTINAHYLEAWELGLSLTQDQGTEDEKYFGQGMHQLKLRLNPNDLKAHSDYVYFCRDVLRDEQATETAQLNFIYARQHINPQENPAKVKPFYDHIERDPFILDLLKKPQPAKIFLSLFVAAATCDKLGENENLRLLVKKRFKSNDPTFATLINKVLLEAEKPGYSKKDRAEFYAVILYVCAANDKRADIKNLLLKNETIIKLLKGEKIFDEQPDNFNPIESFTPKCQATIREELARREKLAQREEAAKQNPPRPGLFARLFGGGQGAGTNNSTSQVDNGMTP